MKRAISFRGPQAGPLPSRPAPHDGRLERMFADRYEVRAVTREEGVAGSLVLPLVLRPQTDETPEDALEFRARLECTVRRMDIVRWLVRDRKKGTVVYRPSDSAAGVTLLSGDQMTFSYTARLEDP